MKRRITVIIVDKAETREDDGSTRRPPEGSTPLRNQKRTLKITPAWKLNLSRIKTRILEYFFDLNQAFAKAIRLKLQVQTRLTNISYFSTN